MKGLLKKTIAILVLMMIMINSSLLVVISTAIDAIDKIIDETKINPLYEINLEKYINYSIEEDTGTLVQFNLKTGIEYVEGEEYKPLSSTKVTLNVPKMEEGYPESVEVIGKSTKATNGSDDAKDFEYTYDKETGELKIEVSNNKDEEGNIYNQNVDGARDEYIIICYYSSNCYNDKNDERNLEVKGLIQTIIADDSKTERKSEFSQNYTVTENVSGLISTNVKTSDIYNGYINSNKRNETDYKTEYLENLEINISKKEISDEVTLKINDVFVDEKDNIIETSDIIYKSTKINKKDLLDILGEDGYLQIFNEKGELLGEVNKDTQVEEDNICEIKYDDLNRIIVKTSKPLKVGTILLQNVREIKEAVINEEINRIKTDINISCINNVEINNEISEEVINEENNIENEIENKIENTIKEDIDNNIEDVDNEIEKDNTEQSNEKTIEEIEVYNFVEAHMIEIKKAQSKAELAMNRTEWTNNIQNEVEFTVKLLSNSSECKLFENPVIEIRMPNEVEKIVLNEYSLLYANGLSVDNVEVIEDNDTKIIRAKLSGMQEEYYNNSMIDGTELLISASVIIKKDIYSMEGAVQFNCLNNNGAEESINEKYDINIVSINNKFEEEEVQVPNEGEQNPSNEQEPNNRENEIEGIITEINATLGEKALEDGQTVYEHEYIRYNIKIKNESNYRKENINVIGKIPEGTTFVRCYFGEYSEEEHDLYHTEEDNTVTEYSQNISLNANEEVNLEYWIRANLLEEGKTENNIETDISILIGEEIVSEYKINNTVKKAKLEMTVTSNKLGSVNNLWLYNFSVKNNTEQDITNVIADIKLPDEIKFVKMDPYYNKGSNYSVEETTTGIRINFPKIEANETQTPEITMQAVRIDENKIDFEAKTYGTVRGDNTDTYHSNLNKEEIHTFAVQVTQTSNKEGKELQYGEEIEFNVKIKDISSDKVFIGTKYIKVLNYANTNLIPVSVEYEYDVEANNESGKERIKRTRDISIKNVINGVDSSTIPDVDISVGMIKGGEANITIKYKVGAVKERTEISNCIKIQYEDAEKQVVDTSNIIKNTIAPTQEEPEPKIKLPSQEWQTYKQEQTSQSNAQTETKQPNKTEQLNQAETQVQPDQEEKTYSISGFAWEDKNKDGKYNNDETKFKNITVKLFNAETNSIVTTTDGKNLEVMTNDDGEYKFENVKNGKYLVLFEHDSNNYELTSYKKDLVAEDKNSDVVTKQVSIDGVEKTVGLTDILEVKDENIGYVNTGVVKNEKFDLSLDKSITKMKVTYDGFEKEYTYNESKLVKVEIPSKKISGAKIEVEYQIKVTNEGEADGYVDEIVDYLPEGFSFDKEQNSGWTQSSSGMLKNTSYSGIIIKPGETKVITLYLTRTLKNETIGTLRNSAEILKSSSVNGDKDIDSINGNKVETEDDFSVAEVIISINTGTIRYIGIAIALSLAIIFILKILIDKKIISMKKLGVFIIGLVVVGIVAVPQQNSSYTTVENRPNKPFDSTNTAPEITDDEVKAVILNYAQSKHNGSVQLYDVNVGSAWDCESGTEPDIWKNTNEKYRFKGNTAHKGEHTTSVKEYKYYFYDKDNNIIATKDEDHSINEFEGCVRKEGPNWTGNWVNEAHDCTYHNYYITYGYVTHGYIANGNIPLRELYCTDGQAMAVGSPGWTYSLSSIELNSTVVHYGDVTNAVWINNNSHATYLPYNYDSEGNYNPDPEGKYNSDYFIVGPFNFTTNGILTEAFPSEGTLCDREGKPISGISSGEDFYVLVTKDVKNVRVWTNAKSVATIKYSIEGSWTEHWITEDASTGETPQVIGYRDQTDGDNGDYDYSDELQGELPFDTYDYAEATATIPFGTLKIQKKDYDTDKILTGYKVTICDPYFHYLKSFEIGEEGFIEINDLPVEKSWYEQIGQNDNNEPVYELHKEDLVYEIVEIEAPKTHDIDMQRKLKLDKVEVILNKDNTVSIENEFKNREFTTKDIGLEVRKRVFGVQVDDKDVNMEDVEFKIYVETKDGSGWIKEGYSINLASDGTPGKLEMKDFVTDNIDEAKVFTTDKDGKFNLKGLPMGTYYFKEIKLPEQYVEYYNMSEIQPFSTYEGALNEETESSVKEVYTDEDKGIVGGIEGEIFIDDTMKRGHLILTKMDYDTKEYLAGAEFNITNNLDKNDVRYINIDVTIPASGILRIDNLPIGEYTITETKAPKDYNIGLQITEQKVIVKEDPEAVLLEHQKIDIYEIKSIPEGEEGVVVFDYKNREYGDLTVQKVDKDTGKPILDTEIFKDVEFKIYYTTPEDSTPRYIKGFIENTEGEVKYELETTTDPNDKDIKIFKTDENGRFEVKNLPNYYIYHIVEVNLPIELAQYYDIRSDSVEVVLENNYDGTNKNVVTESIFENEQEHVDLEGYVWEDIASGKTTTRDEVYNEGSADKRIPNITVYLKKNGNIIATRKTNSNGEYLFEARGYKDKAGLAGLDDFDYTIGTKTLSQYVVEFEYNGLKYEKVLTNLGADNGSKATEKDSNRTNFNEKFYNIQKDRTGTGANLTYTRPEAGVSELVQNTQYTVDSLNNSVNPNTEALMLADTATAGYKIKWSAGVRRIRNINLGIFERAQPDLSIATDLNDIQLTINGSYSHTYEYKSRSPYMNNTGIPDKDINPGYDAVLDGFSVGVKRENGTYRDCSYTREIYDSYIAYTKANRESNDKLRVFVKYSIAIKNESGSLVSRASLKNYADNRLNYSYSYYLDGNGNQVPVNWSSAGNGVWQSEEITTNINPSECIYVYLTYELNTDTIIAMANLQNGETLKMNDNITEISAYSTWDRNGNRYGGIDKDSAPDNVQIGNFDTYEDDTDVAPGLSFARKTSKVISGLVYEDSTNLGAELKTGEERKGNGIYDNGEKTLSNVDVQIIDCNGNNTTKLYNLDGAGNVIITDAKYMTGNNGEFSFTGLVPGKYRVQYIYGRYDGSTQTKIDDNIEVTTESYKSTIVNADRFRTLIDNGYIDYDSSDPNALWYWYQKADNFNYSSAVDDYSRREMINSNLSTINYNTKTNYENKTDSPENHYMIANTGVMDFPIEDTRIQTTDINYIQGSREYKLKFGIVERPRQSLELNKEISYIRITLSNGQVLLEGDPRTNNMNYVQYPMYGKLKIEIDNEIIEGATIDLQYEITVDNKSELDYNHIRYYRYGDRDNEVLSGIVKINVDAIVDYVDEKLSVTYDIENSDSQIEYYNSASDSVNNKWKLITDLSTETNKLAGIDIQPDVYNALQNVKRTNIAVIKTNQQIGPNQRGIVHLDTKKLLANLTGEDLFDNYTEMIQSSNPVGRFYGVMTSSTTWGYHTPGNFNITNYDAVYDTSESDNNDYINRGFQAQASIIPPTGVNKTVIYCSVGFVTLVLIAGGVIFIKKKVID